MQIRLRELRERLDLTLRDIHNETGVAINTLHLYEKGGTPSINQIEKIAKTYHVSPAWLIGWIDDKDREVAEKVVYVEKNVGRLPPYWNNNNNGQLIKWRESVRLVKMR